MSAWDLRWILLLIGIVILGVLYLLGRHHRTRRSDGLLDLEEEGEQTPAVFINPAQERQDPRLDGMDDELQMLDSLVREASDRAPVMPAAPPVAPAPRREPEHRPVTQPSPASAPSASSAPAPQPREDRPKADRPSAHLPDSERLIVMHVAVPRPNRIKGPVLFAALEAVGLEFNEELGIYQWMVEQFGRRQPVFQVANMLNPGTFDPTRRDVFSTPGVSLFMQLPGPMGGLKALNTMLECAQGLATRMDAQLLDQHRSILTTQAAELMREEIQLYSLRHEHRRPA